MLYNMLYNVTRFEAVLNIFLCYLAVEYVTLYVI